MYVLMMKTGIGNCPKRLAIFEHVCILFCWKISQPLAVSGTRKVKNHLSISTWKVQLTALGFKPLPTILWITWLIMTSHLQILREGMRLMIVLLEEEKYQKSTKKSQSLFAFHHIMFDP